VADIIVPDLEYFRAKLARQIEQFCRATRRHGVHPTADDIDELFRQTKKTRKQLELLEDAVVIYHLKHGERKRVWYIDTKDHPALEATIAIRDFKECLNDRKLPST